MKEEKELIKKGELRDENPLDLSKEFSEFLEACRKGNLRRAQEMISAGININAKDEFDYTPLVLVSPVSSGPSSTMWRRRGLTACMGRQVCVDTTSWCSSS